MAEQDAGLPKRPNSNAIGNGTETIRSLRDILEDLSAILRADLSELMAVSGLTPFRNDPGSGVVFISPRPNYWKVLPTGVGPQLQRKTRKSYASFIDMFRLIAGTDLYQRWEGERADYLISAIEQNAGSGYSTLETHHRAATESLDEAMAVVDEMTGPEDGDEPMLVLDTSALYANPWLEDWSFEQLPRFCLVLVPATLRELDRHKDGGHPNRDVVQKAQKVVRQIREYRRRGAGGLMAGVPLRRDRSRIQAWPEGTSRRRHTQLVGSLLRRRPDSGFSSRYRPVLCGTTGRNRHA